MLEFAAIDIMEHALHRDVNVLQAYVAVRPEKKLNMSEMCETRVNDTMQNCEQDKLRCIINLLHTYRLEFCTLLDICIPV